MFNWTIPFQNSYRRACKDKVKRNCASMVVWLATVIISFSASAADYYVDAAAGSDSNSGQNASSPWKTLAKVSASTFASGTNVFLKRGSTWKEALTISSSGVTIDAYGSGALPTLDSSVPVTGWTQPLLTTSGIYASPTITLATIGVGALGNVSENGVLLPLAAWNTNASVSLASAPTPSFTYDNNAKVIYIKVASNPNTSGNTYAASTLVFGVTAANLSDININNLLITRFSLNGVDFTNCTRCSVNNLTITNGGGASLNPTTTAGNGLQWDGSSSYGVANGVTIQNVLDSGISPQTFTQGSNLHDIQINNSTIDRAGFAGVEISLLSPGPQSSLSNITVSNVTVTNSGRGWGGNRYGQTAVGIRVGDDASAGDISGVTIQQATVLNSIGNGVDIGGEVGTVTLNRLRVSGNAIGIYARAATGQGQTVKILLSASIIDSNLSDGFQYVTPNGLGFSLLQNTFYQNGTINVHISGENGQAVIENNIFAADIPMWQIYVDNLVNNSGILYGAAVDHNCYSQSTGMIFYKGVSYSSLAAFSSTLGFELNGIASAIISGINATGVGLVNPGSGVFSLNANSPCIGDGMSGTGVAADYFDMPYKTIPSIGAEEQSSSIGSPGGGTTGGTGGSSSGGSTGGTATGGTGGDTSGGGTGGTSGGASSGTTGGGTTGGAVGGSSGGTSTGGAVTTTTGGTSGGTTTGGGVGTMPGGTSGGSSSGTSTGGTVISTSGGTTVGSPSPTPAPTDPTSSSSGGSMGWPSLLGLGCGALLKKKRCTKR